MTIIFDMSVIITIAVFGYIGYSMTKGMFLMGDEIIKAIDKNTEELKKLREVRNNDH